ncbi:MAG: DUF4294 domain-containing protein [Bacteroidales bacterium]|nr:DUF4294 domain-containing protein [Bacteroidales bacterium]MDY0216623.1 DUF4294 domain-containing protein [Bacteroidales bacterium]
MKKITAITTLLFIFGIAYSQVTSDKIVAATILDGDTIPYLSLREVSIVSWRPFRSAAEEQAHRRLVNNIRFVYPYAKVASAKMRHYDNLSAAAKNRRERNKISKRAEEEIKAQFENDIRNMSQSQGILLIKLIDRESGKSSYEIISATRGKFRAVFWQSFSYFWGINLKEQYDPNGKDKEIETIINLIDAGLI